jgi:hypothetical protein
MSDNNFEDKFFDITKNEHIDNVDVILNEENYSISIDDFEEVNGFIEDEYGDDEGNGNYGEY